MMGTRCASGLMVFATMGLAVPLLAGAGSAGSGVHPECLPEDVSRTLLL